MAPQQGPAAQRGPSAASQAIATAQRTATEHPHLTATLLLACLAQFMVILDTSGNRSTF